MENEFLYARLLKMDAEIMYFVMNVSLPETFAARNVGFAIPMLFGR